MFAAIINEIIYYFCLFVQDSRQVLIVLINKVAKYFDVVILNSDHVRKIIENNNCQTMLYNYFEKTSIDVILIMVAIGLETCFVTLLIFIIQQTSRSGNKMYKICNISNTIFSYTSFKSFTVFNIIIIVIIIFGKIFLPYICGYCLLIYL